MSSRIPEETFRHLHAASRRLAAEIACLPRAGRRQKDSPSVKHQAGLADARQEAKAQLLAFDNQLRELVDTLGPLDQLPKGDQALLSMWGLVLDFGAEAAGLADKLLDTELRRALVGLGKDRAVLAAERLLQ